MSPRLPRPDRKTWSVDPILVEFEIQGRIRRLAANVPRFENTGLIAFNPDGTAPANVRPLIQGKSRQISGTARRDGDRWIFTPHARGKKSNGDGEKPVDIQETAT